MSRCKILALLVAAAVVVCSCSTKSAVDQHAFVAPLQPQINLDSLSSANANVPAEFCVDDFNWMGGNLTFSVAAEDLYDEMAINNLQQGDSLVYNGDTIIVNTIDMKNGVTINGGLEEGGAWLWPHTNGTYQAAQFDDHSIYTNMGKVELPLADDFGIIDCKDDPNLPSDTILSDQKLYLENLKDSRRTFTFLDTKIVINDGVIVNITRRWIP